MQPLLNIAITAARAASDIIIRHMEKLDQLTITKKDFNEGYFSEVDIKAEQAIIKTILKAYPSHGIIAEESGVHNPEAETVWIIDALDGTTNYLHGYPAFCVSIAVQINNHIEHAVIYDPLRHECFSGSRGRGAKLNDRRMRVSKQTQLNSALLSCSSPFRFAANAQEHLAAFKVLFSKSEGIRRTGSSALDLAYLASGRIDGFVELGLHIWDCAAGCLLIKEAGGLISDIQGGENYLQSGNIIAGTTKIFKTLLQTFMTRI